MSKFITTLCITLGCLSPLGEVISQTPQISAVASGGPATVSDAVTTLIVDRYEDDREAGSLRWAIETSNANPDSYLIEISAPKSGRPQIILNSPLPAVKGPVSIVGAAWLADGRHTVIDGSGYIERDLRSCPGATEGQFGTNIRTTSFPGIALVDTREVMLQGLEIRNFCIGVLVLRTSNSVFVDNRFVRNIGGAGLMFSGDDGGGGSTSDTTINNKVLRNTFYENGDGLELTRGAAFNLVADNIFDAGQDNLEPSQGIEILWGNDNTVVHNRFVNYTDGLQLNWGARNYIGANTFRGNAFGISVTGASNIIGSNTIRNNGVGIAVRPEAEKTSNRLTQNSLAGNGQLILRCSAGGSCSEDIPRGAIVIGLPGLEHAEYVGSRGMGVVQNTATQPHICALSGNMQNCHQAPQLGQRAPVLTSARQTAQGTEVTGTLEGPVSTRITVEVFSGEPGTDEAEIYLGSVVVATDAEGKSEFRGTVDPTDVGNAVAATLTTALGTSSSLSSAISVSR